MNLLQGVSSHEKPGKVMEFHYFFPGLEKSWKLTPGFGFVPFFHPAFQYQDRFI